LRLQEFAERLDAADDHQEIVLPAEREHGVDQIVPSAQFSELHLQPISKETQQFSRYVISL
ncbi:hypothetical protein ABTE31_21065, partial [Acinetobacter baumannii]